MPQLQSAAMRRQAVRDQLRVLERERVKLLARPDAREDHIAEAVADLDEYAATLRVALVAVSGEPVVLGVVG